MKTQTQKISRKSSPAAASNSWAAQNGQGRKQADVVLGKLLEGAPEFILEREISRMVEYNIPRGVLVGFCQRIGEAAKRGAYLQ